MDKDELIDIVCKYMNYHNTDAKYIHINTDGKRYIDGGYQTDIRYFLNKVKDMDYWNAVDFLKQEKEHCKNGQ